MLGAMCAFNQEKALVGTLSLIVNLFANLRLQLYNTNTSTSSAQPASFRQLQVARPLAGADDDGGD